MAIFFAVVLFLTATSGFTLYTHYCSDTEIQKQSLIASQITCEHNSDVPSCSCTSNICLNTSKSDNCCSDVKHFFKVTDFFNLPSVPQEDICFNSHTIITLLALLNIEHEKYYEEPVSLYSLPPPKSGKNIVLLFHQLKTDPDTIA